VLVTITKQPSGKKFASAAHQTRSQDRGLVEPHRKSSGTQPVPSVPVLFIYSSCNFFYLKLFKRRWHFCISFSFAPLLLRTIALTTIVLSFCLNIIHYHYTLCIFPLDRNEQRLFVSALIRTLLVIGRRNFVLPRFRNLTTKLLALTCRSVPSSFEICPHFLHISTLC